MLGLSGNEAVFLEPSRDFSNTRVEWVQSIKGEATNDYLASATRQRCARFGFL